jgi:peptidoglycan hydrolase-like protein with peptidoglycan-binding domain
MPVPGAQVTIESQGQTVYSFKTDASGRTEPVKLNAPDASHTMSPADPGPYYATYDVTVSAPGYGSHTERGVQIYDGLYSVLPTDLRPGEGATESAVPDNSLHESATRRQIGAPEGGRQRLGAVTIPSSITVHLGNPSSSARNITVPFVDYIKNVASGEIYPTWPEAALEANIYAIISFALNRVYTEWYRGQGYSFQITSSTAYDMSYAEGRNIFSNISDIVDRIFNSYIRRQGRIEPYFSAFCNGTTVTCPGLSQWGTVDYARQGLSPLSILKKYYPQDIQIATTNNIGGSTTTFPGVLSQGSTGQGVRYLQDYLTRIRADYPLIPAITDPKGTFGASTAQAVKVFQQIFGLPQDGIVGQNTWYSILRRYVAVTKLASLESEGLRNDIGDTPPSVTLSQGSRGEAVVELQYILDVISAYYDEIPAPARSGVFDAKTLASVRAFQQMKGLSADGVVGPSTWSALYSLFRSITSNWPPEPENPGDEGLDAYPGYILQNGARGDDVRELQRALNVMAGRYPGLPTVAVDGVFGPGTQAAVIALQQRLGLTADGKVGPVTWNALRNALGTGSGGILKEGSQGDEVRDMQLLLNQAAANWGTPYVTADGIFGPATKAAVIAFQKAAGIAADGIVGPQTLSALTNAASQTGAAAQAMATVQTIPAQATEPAEDYGGGLAYPGAPLVQGSVGEEVSAVQYSLGLIAERYPFLEAPAVDGVYGPDTAKAVADFQKSMGLTPDGEVGLETWQTIVRVAVGS